MSTRVKFDTTDILTFTAPSTMTSGVPFLIGNVIVIPLGDAASGAEVACQVRGRCSTYKTNAQAWTLGDPIYWNSGTGRVTNVQTGLLRQIGQAGEAAANPSDYGYVDLGVGVEADSDLGTFKADLASTTDAA